MRFKLWMEVIASGFEAPEAVDGLVQAIYQKIASIYDNRRNWLLTLNNERNAERDFLDVGKPFVFEDGPKPIEVQILVSDPRYLNKNDQQRLTGYKFGTIKGGDFDNSITMVVYFNVTNSFQDLQQLQPEFTRAVHYHLDHEKSHDSRKAMTMGDMEDPMDYLARTFSHNIHAVTDTDYRTAPQEKDADFTAISADLDRSGKDSTIRDLMYNRYLSYGQERANRWVDNPKLRKWFSKRFSREGYKLDGSGRVYPKVPE